MTATSFELFGTLVDVTLPDDPAAAVGRELADRGVALPDDWAAAYEETHIDPPAGAVAPLPAHVSAALASRGVDAPGNAPRRAVVAAFDPEVQTREGAQAAVAAAADRGPVAVLADAPAPELARRTLIRSAVDRSLVDATVSTAACGWALTHDGAHETVARRLDADRVCHVGRVAVDRTNARDVTETPLPALAREWSESPEGADP